MPEISFAPVHSILKENLNTCWITSKFMPCLLVRSRRTHARTFHTLPTDHIHCCILLSLKKTEDDFKGEGDLITSP
jgi:hypothetical protein